MHAGQPDETEDASCAGHPLRYLFRRGRSLEQAEARETSLWQVACLDRLLPAGEYSQSRMPSCTGHSSKALDGTTALSPWLRTSRSRRQLARRAACVPLVLHLCSPTSTDLQVVEFVIQAHVVNPVVEILDIRSLNRSIAPSRLWTMINAEKINQYVVTLCRGGNTWLRDACSVRCRP